MKVLVIGAGAAGLVAAKYVSENNYDCDVLEMRPQLGGTWVYTEDVNTDRYGFSVYSATYESMKANIPKEVMGYPDFPISSTFSTYPTHKQMREFLEQYADHHKLNELIKFNCLVTDIRPINKEQWRVTYVEKNTKTERAQIYDVVMICSGNYNKGNIPNVPGMSIFKGEQYHSRQYRTPNKFESKTVLVIGAGPSGADLALEVSTRAKTVLMSHHSAVLTAEYPSNVVKKPDIAQLKEWEVEFVDGSSSKVDAIFYCTGFNYSYPYLHDSCGIEINDNYITPLYKHMIHMERPTMCIIGIPVQVCAFPMFDLQCRFYTKYLNGDMRLPTLEEMRRDTDEEMRKRWSSGCKKRDSHKMGTFQQEYYDTLANLAGTASLPPVIIKVRDNSFERFYKNLSTFRSDRYKIIDNESYIHII